MHLSPRPDILEILTLVLGVEIHERTYVFDHPLAEDASVGCTHDLLAQDIEAIC
jgi:hypothetical protein